MKNKIALTAILAVLATNVAFAHTFDAGDTTGNCYPDDIPSGVTENTELTPVQYNASWGNKTYTITFDKNNVDASGEKTPANCKYFDSNETPPVDADECLALQSVATFAEAGKIITGWNTKATPDSNSTAIPLTATHLKNLDNSALGAESNTAMTLYAQWANCTFQYDGTTQPDYITITASNTTNVCQYTVSCGAGYHLHDVDTGYGTNGVYVYDTYGSNTDPLIVNIPADACVSNEIYLSWDANHGKIGDADTATGECFYGTPDGITVPQPTRPGYTFEGWDINNNTNNNNG